MWIRLYVGKSDNPNRMNLRGKRRARFDVLGAVDLFFTNYVVYRMYGESRGDLVYFDNIATEIVYKDDLRQDVALVAVEKVIEALNISKNEEASVALGVISDVVKEHGKADVVLFGMVEKR